MSFDQMQPMSYSCIATLYINVPANDMRAIYPVIIPIGYDAVSYRTILRHQGKSHVKALV